MAIGCECNGIITQKFRPLPELARCLAGYSALYNIDARKFAETAQIFNSKRLILPKVLRRFPLKSD